jgi:hypothetical protein
MNDKLSSVIIFCGGVFIGGFLTWDFFKTKYEKIADEEIASVKETFEHREPRPDKNYNVEEVPKVNDTYINVSPGVAERIIQIIDSNGYRNYSNTAIETDKKGGTADMELKQPYVITPEQYEDNVDYTKVSLTWYNDEVLEDDWGNVLDPDDVIGSEALKTFGQYEKDSVFVRDDDEQIDYEVLLDTRSYKETYGHDPVAADQ